MFGIGIIELIIFAVIGLFSIAMLVGVVVVGVKLANKRKD